MAVVSSRELGSPMRTGHQTLAGIQAAMDVGMEDEEFTRITPQVSSPAGNRRRKRTFQPLRSGASDSRRTIRDVLFMPWP